jgi:xylose dehydrogenase (NAD/NADP)
VTIRWGLLSTARINKLVLEGARESDCVEVIAVVSRERARAQAYARENLIERAYDGYEALLADTEVDAVYISLPNALHVEWTLRALEAGKHVLTEKPFSRRAAEVEAAFDVADRYELVLSEGFMWRHHPQTRALEDLLAGNAIGRLRLVRAAFSFPLATVHGPDDTRFDPQLAGGALMDVGCYCVNAIRAFGGEPVEVQAHQVVGETGVDVVFAASLRLSNNVLAHFDCGFVVPFRDELELVGEDASLFVADPFHVHVPGIELRRGSGTERLEVPAANSYRLELENVSDAICGRAPLLLGRGDAVGQARAIEALYDAAAVEARHTSA